MENWVSVFSVIGRSSPRIAVSVVISAFGNSVMARAMVWTFSRSMDRPDDIISRTICSVCASGAIPAWESARSALLDLPWSADQQACWSDRSDSSVARRIALEQGDTLDFEEWRQQYMAARGLG